MRCVEQVPANLPGEIAPELLGPPTLPQNPFTTIRAKPRNPWQYLFTSTNFSSLCDCADSIPIRCA